MYKKTSPSLPPRYIIIIISVWDQVLFILLKENRPGIVHPIEEKKFTTINIIQTLEQ